MASDYIVNVNADETTYQLFVDRYTNNVYVFNSYHLDYFSRYLYGYQEVDVKKPSYKDDMHDFSGGKLVPHPEFVEYEDQRSVGPNVSFETGETVVYAIPDISAFVEKIKSDLKIKADGDRIDSFEIIPSGASTFQYSSPNDREEIQKLMRSIAGLNDFLSDSPYTLSFVSKYVLARYDRSYAKVEPSRNHSFIKDKSLAYMFEDSGFYDLWKKILSFDTLESEEDLFKSAHSYGDEYVSIFMDAYSWLFNDENFRVLRTRPDLYSGVIEAFAKYTDFLIELGFRQKLEELHIGTGLLSGALNWYQRSIRRKS